MTINININKVLFAILVIAAVLCCFYLLRKGGTTIVDVEDIEYTDSVGRYHKVYKDEDFKALKDENKALYDSLKEYRDQITYLINFKAKNEYKTDTVYTSNEVSDTVKAETYEYTNEPNDTMAYTLRVHAEKEPIWYSLDITTNSEYTIVNKSYDDDMNHVTIEGDGEITDVTVFKRKEKRGVMDRLSVGPSIGVGYDPLGKRVSPTIGISVTYDILRKK